MKVGGHRVDPQEIEDTIMESQKLIEIAVIGIADDLLGYKLHALAVPLDDSTTQNDLLSFASGLLPRHKVPESLFFIRSLPKNANGKINREACKNYLLSQLSKQ